ncbi:hypothetical protein L3i22_000730 [Actinoplanes sp. L3-i22]|nr:hypothetical protein L3i22_000730 [Actinoplanes sp. L3-i22]
MTRPGTETLAVAGRADPEAGRAVPASRGCGTDPEAGPETEAEPDDPGAEVDD